MKKKPLARIRYIKDHDAFRIETKSPNEKEWGLDEEYKCFVAMEEEAGSEPMYIYCGAMVRINNLLDMGYEFVCM